MGGALAHGWLKSGKVGLTLVDRDTNILQRFQSIYADAVREGRLRTLTDSRSATENADMIVLVVKPWLMPDVITEIRDKVDLKRQTVVSDAAGFGTDKLEKAFGREGQYFYVIPNIAAEYGSSMSFVAAHPAATDDSKRQVRELYALCGEVLEVRENQVAAGMMMASCGIAYVMRMIRAMQLAGTEMGFYPNEAQKIAQQTMLGAVRLLGESGLHPEAAIDKVTTPGGVTIKGLNEMDMAGFNAAVIRGLKAGLK